MTPSKWGNFLNSLATPGGNLFLLFLLVMLFVPTIILLMIKFGPGAPVVITMASITSGFAGALMNGTNGNSGNGARRGTDPVAPPIPPPGVAH